MITAINFKKAQQAIESAKQQAAIEMPKAIFVFTGADNENIYFDLVAKNEEVTTRQMLNIKQKTRFYFIKGTVMPIYKAEFKMSL